MWFLVRCHLYLILFFRLFAIGSQLSPEPHSSGIEVLETDGFKLHCYQTMTGNDRARPTCLMLLIVYKEGD